MFLFIAVILLVAGIVLRTLAKHKEKPLYKTLSTLGFVAAGIAVVASTIVIIPTGNTGVKTTLGQISEQTLPTGFALQIPLVQNIEIVSNKKQDQVIHDQVWAESRDKVQVYGSQFYITYQINPEYSALLLSTVSNFRADLINSSMVTSSFKDATSSLASKEVTVRGKVEPLTQEFLQNRVNDKYGEEVIFINQVIVNDMNFEDSYNQAIAQKNRAELQYEQAQTVNQTAIESAEAQKVVTETNATAEAQALIIAAEAQAQSNHLLAESITPEVLAYMEMQARQKHGWITIQGATTAIVASESGATGNSYTIPSTSQQEDTEVSEGTGRITTDYGG